MLFLILFLVVAAFGVLIASLAASMMLLAWVSVGVSVLAALLLLFDSWRRRRARRRVRRSVAVPAPKTRRELVDDEATGQDVVAGSSGAGHTQDDEGDAEEFVAADEPAVEQTSRDDLLVVSEMDDEVLVIDERPRYHQSDCEWLASRPTLPLPVCEARELGFTPCARCAPDAELLVRHRAQPAGEAS